VVKLQLLTFGPTVALTVCTLYQTLIGCSKNTKIIRKCCSWDATLVNFEMKKTVTW